MKYRFLQFTLFLTLLTACTSAQRKPPEFKWGQSFKTVTENELQRLGTEPIEQKYPEKTGIALAMYRDRFLNAHCNLTYWFEANHLQVVAYSCSNANWKGSELKDSVAHQLSSLNGEPISIIQGDKTYDYYRAQDAHIYFRMVRIPAEGWAKRTFQVNIFYSHFSHETYKPLKDILSTYGR